MSLHACGPARSEMPPCDDNRGFVCCDLKRTEQVLCEALHKFTRDVSLAYDGLYASSYRRFGVTNCIVLKGGWSTPLVEAAVFSEMSLPT